MSEKSLKELIDRLTNGSAPQRGAAAFKLGEMTAKEAEPALINALSDEKWSVRQAALAALVKINPDRDPDEIVRATRRGLHDAATGAPTAEELVRSGLWRLRSLNPTETLMEAVEQPGALRPAYVSALGEIGDSRAVDSLGRVLRDPEAGRGSRAAAAEALGRFVENGDAVMYLVTALDDPSRSVRRAATKSLLRSGDAAREVISGIDINRRSRRFRRAAKRVQKRRG